MLLHITTTSSVSLRSGCYLRHDMLARVLAMGMCVCVSACACVCYKSVLYSAERMKVVFCIRASIAAYATLNFAEITVSIQK